MKASTEGLPGDIGRRVRLGLNRRFFRFLVVGGVNTLFGYLVFLIALSLCPTTFSALILSTIVAVLFSFLSQGKYVFRNVELDRLWRFALTYGLVFGFNAAGLNIMERSGIVPGIAGLILLPASALMSYGLNSRFVFVKAAAWPTPT